MYDFVNCDKEEKKKHKHKISYVKRCERAFTIISNIAGFLI